MALHGLAEITIGVPDVPATQAFYSEFGLASSAPGVLATADGGDQLRLVQRSYRHLVEYVLAADDADDLARISSAATAHDIDVSTHDDSSISLIDPICGIRARVTVRPRIRLRPYESPPTNTPGNASRVNDRSPAIFEAGPAQPRKLGHVLYATPDLDASMRFVCDVLGFKVSDTSAGVIAFLRCSDEHHNIGMTQAPLHFFHHSSWMVNDVDEIGKGAKNLLAGDPSRSVWGLGRHFLGSNLFWYFRDPAGNFAEYYADLDQIPSDADWEPRNWAPDKSLYAWGPPPPAEFIAPRDLDEIAGAQAAAERAS
jgi:catechol 2,3-dioxygenase-like lactoylglutathione lyase family enzyme